MVEFFFHSDKRHWHEQRMKQKPVRVVIHYLNVNLVQLDNANVMA